MLMTLFWIGTRFLFAALPLFLAIMAAQRAFRSGGPNAAVYMAYSGFAAVSGVSVLPWAMRLEPPNGAALLMCLVASLGWLLLNALLRRPVTGYRPRVARRAVFRHRSPQRPTLPEALERPAATPEAGPQSRADWPVLTFLPRGDGPRLQ